MSGLETGFSARRQEEIAPDRIQAGNAGWASRDPHQDDDPEGKQYDDQAPPEDGAFLLFGHGCASGRKVFQ
jgi:hypothetical protein